jgi:transcriptional regulator of NAD metabolism
LNVKERRNEIIKILMQADGPVAAKELAVRFHVSRQVIVQDMAVLRAVNSDIVSTCRGYILQKEARFSREIKVCHDDEDIARELNLIVDYGGRVKNVSIKHRVYGRITVDMDIASRQDVDEFLELLQSGKSTSLGSATAGYHYHLIEAASNERLDRIANQLKQAGLLAPLTPWEQENEMEEQDTP